MQPVFDGQSLLRLDHEYSHVQQSLMRVSENEVYIYIHRVYQYIGISLRCLKIASFIENMINKQWIWGYYIFRHPYMVCCLLYWAVCFSHCGSIHQLDQLVLLFRSFASTCEIMVLYVVPGEILLLISPFISV